MASTPDSEVSQIISLFSSIQTGNYAVVSIIGLLVYAWATTFAQEVNLFWKRQFTGATLLFIANRYIPIVYFASSFSGGYALSDQV
ncbi:hypothetical protein C8Q74DRAFT_1368024 [Fomes fomentarius]|nr:hypothetical protein C8Q74DRAFT_1368024 [Fomes fomentarius]